MEVNSRRGEVQMENIIISGFADEIDPNLDKQIEVVKRLGIWLVQSVEHVILDVRVVGLKPMLDVEITLKKKE